MTNTNTNTTTPSKIPLVDLKAQYAAIHGAVDSAIQSVLDSTNFIMGPEVKAFERAFAAYCGVAECAGVASGTAALDLVLRALGVGPGDEVITVAHTFIATAEAISAVGARPVFVDIDPLTYTMQPAALAAAITPRTRAILPVHIYGQPADMDAIMAIARRHALPVVEDAAQAHGATWNGVRAGALGTAACFSFYPGKNLGAYGDAGAVTSADADLAAQVRLLRNHGRHSKYLHEVKGFGERIDTLQAAVLLAKLAYLDEWTAARRRLAVRYSELLADCDLALPHVAPQADPAWHLYVIRTPQRDALLEHLQANGIGAGVHYPVPLHLQPAYAELGYSRGALPVSEEVADTCLSLPLYPEMTGVQQERVAAVIREFVGVHVHAR
jgi:dTDP-4-amino-4,6-dideoxygalactose transaminase